MWVKTEAWHAGTWVLETLPGELLLLGSPQLDDGSRALYLLNSYFLPCDLISEVPSLQKSS